MKTLILLVFLAVLLRPSAVFGVIVDTPFEKLDKDGNSELTPDEVRERNWQPGLFGLMDLDGGGTVSAAEYRTWRQDPSTLKKLEELTEATFVAIDTDNDGRLYRDDEWIGSEELFSRKDRNKDAYIYKREARGEEI